MRAGAGAAGSPRGMGHAAVSGAHRARHPAQLFDLLMGPVLLVVGIVGFAASSSFSVADPDASDLIVFDVNGWHNVVHILSGLLLLSGVRSYAAARTATLLFAGAYGLVTVIGWIDGDDVLGLFPTDLADNLLHTFLTLSALAFGLMSAPEGDLRHRLMSHERGGVRTEASELSPTSPATLARADRFRREQRTTDKQSAPTSEGSA
jgi:Domain of unknown function (DUF4383)